MEEELVEPGPLITTIMPHDRLRFTKEVSRVSVSATGTLAVLMGKRSLSVIGLTPPFAVARELVHPGKAAPQFVQWSPHTSHSSFVGSHSGQSIFIWNLNDARNPLQGTIHHQRNVRNFSWSLFDQNVIASSAADNAIHLWDLRDLKSPKAQSVFKVFTSGISSVRWNKHNSNQLASAHDQQVEIWDIRKSSPITFITAHPTKISNIDWSPTVESHLITSSLDGTVKLWDTKKSRTCQGTINTGSPVAKACYTPSSNGIVVLNHSPVLNMRIWGVSEQLDNELIFQLAGNKDFCPDFSCCERVGAVVKDIVAWSRDAHLCMWEMPVLKTAEISSNPNSNPSFLIGVSPGSYSKSPMGTPTKKDSTPAKVNAPPMLRSLREELEDVENNPIPGVTTEGHMAALQRQIVVKTRDLKDRRVCVKIAFPSLYPHNATPSFEFLPQSEIPTEEMATIVAAMQSMCRKLTAQSRVCLRPSLLLLVKTIQSDDLLRPRKRESTNKVSSKEYFAAAAEFPCPRLSGAVFSPSGRLVHFTNGVNFNVRTYMQLKDVLTGGIQAQKLPSLGDENPKEKVLTPVVTHYHLPCVSSINLRLANHYRLSGSPMYDLCLFNSEVARRFGFSNLCRAWKTIAVVISSSSIMPAEHPLSCALVKNILEYFENISDLQTVACISHVLMGNKGKMQDVPCQEDVKQQVNQAMASLKTKNDVSEEMPKVWTKRLFQKNRQKRTGSDAVPPEPLTIAQSITAAHGYLVPSPPTSMISLNGPPNELESEYSALNYNNNNNNTVNANNAASNAYNNHNGSNAVNYSSVTPASASLPNINVFGTSVIAGATSLAKKETCCLLDPSLISHYIGLQHMYTNICLCFSLFKHRAEFRAVPYLKLQNKPGLSFEPTCPKCNSSINGGRYCANCNVSLFECCLCRIPVRGLCSICSVCGHGGHTNHMLEWFGEGNGQCPTGCGCKCSY